jgi:hypothetical protein
MKRLHFTCTLLTDVVLSSHAATEGFHESLNYIPGAKFLGIAARKLYNMQNEQQTLDVFHNGCVRFGDAHPMSESDETTFKVPYSWQYVKGKSLEDEIFLHHRLDKGIRMRLVSSGTQLKQAQKGYFAISSGNGHLIETKQKFSIKSAYDGATYRAKDQKMYGYFALAKGSQWQFEVATDDDRYSDVLKSTLTGKHRMGRSSSAEYGLVEIKLLPINNMPHEAKNVSAGKAYIYAVSNLCFYDDAGSTTCQPDPIKHLLLPQGSKILWPESQIRTRRYMTWNRHRSNRDADRLIIEKGSVIAVNLSSELNTSVLNRGIGAHRSEGFGLVLVNPSFLNSSNEKLDVKLQKAKMEHAGEIQVAVEAADEDRLVLQYLEQRMNETDVELQIDAKVNDFLARYRSKFSGISSSQWGQVRNVAKNENRHHSLHDLLFHDDFGICMGGQSESQWRSCRNLLKQFIFDESELTDEELATLTMKIASEMAKAAQNKERYAESN